MDISNKLKRLARASDFNTPRAVSISGVEEIEVGGQSKTVLYTDEDDTIPLSNDAIRQLTKLCGGSTETEDWVGRVVLAFNDRTVKVNGKAVGGIRFRAASEADIAAARSVMTPAPYTEDIPF